jgi:hypothetical protein
MMIHIAKPNGQTIAINTEQIIMIAEGTDGCHIHFVGGGHTPCSEKYLDLVAKINTNNVRQ